MQRRLARLHGKKNYAVSVSFRNRAPKIEDFSKVSQDSPVAPPRKKKTNWYENGQFD